jgi:hypothetical protein
VRADRRAHHALPKVRRYLCKLRDTTGSILDVRDCEVPTLEQSDFSTVELHMNLAYHSLDDMGLSPELMP